MHYFYFLSRFFFLKVLCNNQTLNRCNYYYYLIHLTICKYVFHIIQNYCFFFFYYYAYYSVNINGFFFECLFPSVYDVGMSFHKQFLIISTLYSIIHFYIEKVLAFKQIRARKSSFQSLLMK